MNLRATHNMIARAMFPNIDPAVIDATNEKIDSVPTWVQAFSTFNNRRLKNQGYQKDSKNDKFVRNPYDVFNLGRQGHRARGHDLLTATLLGAAEARKRGLSPVQGMLSSYAHLAADSYSNFLVDRFGVEGRNVYESLYMWTKRKNKGY